MDADAKLHLFDMGAYRSHVKTLIDQPVEVIVRLRKSKRSLQANARYWAILTCAAESLGWDDVEGLHEALAQKLLALPPCEKTGLPRRMRTPKLNTQEFSAYSDAVIRELIDLGADLTDWESHAERQTRAA